MVVFLCCPFALPAPVNFFLRSSPVSDLTFYLQAFSEFESFLIHESLKIPFGAFVSRISFFLEPKCRKGSHQTPDSESGPWESHPRRVLRRFRRKVSLYPKPVVAVSVVARYFRMVSGSLSTFCPADTVSGRWVLAYLHLAVGSRNVSDECI